MCTIGSHFYIKRNICLTNNQLKNEKDNILNVEWNNRGSLISFSASAIKIIISDGRLNDMLYIGQNVTLNCTVYTYLNNNFTIEWDFLDNLKKVCCTVKIIWCKSFLNSVV